MHKRIMITCTVGLLFIASPNLQAQKIDNDLKAVLKQDSLFWQSYNACNTEAMNTFVTEDLEFYHDKGGIINGLQQFSDVTKKNLCGNANLKLRREPVPGTIQVFPMKSNGTIYGAIISGEHIFYVLEKGEEPKLDGRAKFTHLLMKTEEGWKMSRILSYDHGPAVRK